MRRIKYTVKRIVTITAAAAMIVTSVPVNAYAYTDTESVTADGDPAALPDDLTVADLTYNGTIQSITVRNGDATFSTDYYTVEYKKDGEVADPKNAGAYTAVLTGKNGYTGTKDLTFNINPLVATLVWSEREFFYNGERKCPTATVNNLINGDTCSVTVVGDQINANAEGTHYTATATGLSNDNYALPSEVTVDFTIAKAPPLVLSGNRIPTAKNLSYTGSEEQLINAGETPDGYTMKYAVTESNTAPAASEFSTAIPKKRDIGTYYVWYKATGDSNHEDSAVGCVIVTIDKAEYPDSEIAPVPITGLYYDGEPHRLVTTSVTTGAALSYAVTTEATAPPTDAGGIWNSTPSQKTDAGRYYVWYKAIGDALHKDSIPKSVIATIFGRPITITAKAQSVEAGADIASGTDKVTVTDGSLLTGHRITDVTLTPNSTASVTTSGRITPKDAKIMNGTSDVTANYDITYGTGTLTVTRSTVYISGITAGNREYDGTTKASVSGTPVLRRVSDDTVVSGLTVSNITADFDDAIPGTARRVTIKAGTLSDSRNYTLSIEKTNEKLELSADITPRVVTITGLSVQNKKYDGSTDAVIKGSAVIAGKVGSDDVTVLPGSAAFADADAGTGKKVSFSGFSLGGTAKDNYVLSTQPEVVTADITKADACNIEDIKLSYAYTTKGITTTVAGRMPSDAGTISYKAGTETINRVDGSTLKVSGFTVNETGMLRVTVADGTPGDIIMLPVTIGSVNYEDSSVKVIVELIDKTDAVVTIAEGTNLKKTYGDAPFTLHPNAEYPGKGNGEWSYLSEDPAVATVSDAGMVTIDGAGEAVIIARYESETTTGEAEILLKVEKKLISATGVTAADKEYDGNTSAAVDNNGTLSGVINGDDVSLTSGSAVFEDKNVGIRKVSFSGFALTGLRADNYSLSAQPESVTANITPKAVTAMVTAVNRTYEAGNKKAALTGGRLVGVVIGDDVSIDITGAVGTMKNADAGDDKPVVVTGVMIGGADAGNYRLIQPEGVTVTISRAVWTGSTAAEVKKTYLYTKENSDSYDLGFLIPSDCGAVTYGEPAVTGTVKYKTRPTISDGLLTYTLDKADKSVEGTITVRAQSQNYSNDFTLTVIISQQMIGLYEKVGRDYEIRTLKELTEGRSFVLVPMFVEGGAINKRVVWVSTNPDVATVTQDGKVIAIASGSTTIEVLSEEQPDCVAACEVKVTEPVTSVTLDKSKAIIGTGESVILNAQLLPFTAVQKLRWSTSDTSVAVLWDEDTGAELAGNISGKGKIYDICDAHTVIVKAVGAGGAKVMAEAVDASGKKAVCSLSIGNPVPDFTIESKGNAVSVKAGMSLAMKVNWGDKKSMPKDTGVIWSVTGISGEDVSHIASISAKGVLTGITPGRVRVKAVSTANPSKSACLDFTVTALDKSRGAQVTDITFTNKQALCTEALKSGKGYQVAARLTLSGKGGAAGNAVAWYSSDDSIATVTQKGLIRAVAPGKATITAVVRDAEDIGSAPKDSVSITVRSLITSVQIDKKKLTLGTRPENVYGSVSIAKISPENATDMAIEWKSSNDNVRIAAVTEGSDISKGTYINATGSGLTGTKKATGTGVVVSEGQCLAIKAVNPGVTKLTGITTDGSNKAVACIITVRGEVTGLRFVTKNAGKNGYNDVTLSDGSAPENMKYTGLMKEGTGMTLATVLDINGISGSSTDKADISKYKLYKKYTDTGVSYRSSDTSVLIVDKKGKIFVNKNTSGRSATVYATSSDEKYKAQISITVN